MTTILLLLAGLGLLVVGGELLVRGSVRIAERLGVSPLLIGLTLVGFGTSAPELVTSVNAAIIGSPGIAVGNIVGSNISNILLILGLSTMINPIKVDGQALARDGMLVLVTAVLLFVLGLSGLSLGRLTGGSFLVLLVAYITYTYLQERDERPVDHGAAFEKAEAYGELHDRAPQPGHAAMATGGVLVPLLMAIAGLAVVVVGGKILVDAGIALARTLGMSETLIGLTIIAIGTSMPEFVTSVVAAVRGHSAVALGNILGSNIYNVLGIGGVTGIIAPTMIPVEIARFDNLVMVAASLALIALARTGHRINRAEGAALLLGYCTYLWAIWPK